MADEAGTNAGVPQAAEPVQAAPVSSEPQGTMAEPGGQNQTEAGGAQAAQEPTNYAEAFTILNERDAERSKESVPNEGQEATESGSTANDSVPQDQENNGTTGGPTDTVPSFNRQAYLNQVETQLRGEARRRATAVIDKQAGGKIYANQLAQRDPDTGTLRFINPDNKQEISRLEAQQWCESRNKDRDRFIDMEASKMMPGLRNNVKAAVQTNVYINEEWNKLSPEVQQKMDELTAPYAVYGQDQYGRPDQNKLIGFSCNLYQMQKQAELLVIKDKYDAMVNNGQPMQQATQAAQPAARAKPAPVSTPAVDANTANNIPAEMNVDNVKNYTDAFNYLYEMEKEKNNG